MTNIEKAWNDLLFPKPITFEDLLEKGGHGGAPHGKKDVSKLIKKRIVNTLGKVQTVYVAAGAEHIKRTKKHQEIEAEAIRKKQATEEAYMRVSTEMGHKPNIELPQGGGGEKPHAVETHNAQQSNRTNTKPQEGKMGRHNELYGFHIGDLVSTKVKGEDKIGSLQYWNINKSSPQGYAVIVLEDGTKLERNQSALKLHKPVGSEGHQPITKDSIRENLNEQAGEVEGSQKKESIHDTDVNKRFDTMVKMIRAVGRGLQKSLIIYGSGGTGKTYTVTKEMEKLGKVPFDEDFHQIGSDDYDYVSMTGKVSPAALYRTLYEHNGKTVVFDDCDSFMKDADAVNVLKGALDTSGNGTIAWQSQVKIKDSEGEEIPKRFKFNGNAIFISNLNSEQVPQPLKSRSLRIDMTMSKEDTVKRIGHILDKIDFEIPGVTEEDKRETLKFLKENLTVTDDVNVRTLKSLLVLKKTSDDKEDFEESAKHFLLSKAGDFEGVIVSMDEYTTMKGDIDVSSFKQVQVNIDGDEKIVFVK